MMKFLHLPPLFPVNRNLIALLCCLLFLWSVPQAGADTTVGGTISTDTTWTVSGSPYIVNTNIIIQGADGPDGITTLTIEPGVMVKFNGYRYMNIGSSTGDPGALIAQGSLSNPIVFTANKTSPVPGDWYGIRFYNTTDDATTVMEHCEVEYGGYSNGSLYVYQASPTLRNVAIRNSKTFGAYVYNSQPVFENCTLSDNLSYDLYYRGTYGGSVTGCTINHGIYQAANGMVNFSGCIINQDNAFPIRLYPDSVGGVSASTFNNVDADSHMQVNGATLSRDSVWAAAMPFVVMGNLAVKGTDGSDGVTTLAIQAGAVLKFNPYLYMDIGAASGAPGALIAQGTAQSPVVFTSNQVSPAPGDWYGIRISDTADDATTRLEHCQVEYGGYNNLGQVYIYRASPTLRNVTLRNSGTFGAYVFDSEPVFENCTFINNLNYDFYYRGSFGGSVTGSTINSGIWQVADGTVSFAGNTINQNNAFPIRIYPDNVGGVSASTFNNVDAASYMQVNGGSVTLDAAWTAAMPYIVKGNLSVKGTDGADGVTTLEIQAGAVLKFDPTWSMDIGAASGDPGALIVQGTAQSPIVFTSNQAVPAPADWSGIRIYNTADDATTRLEHCQVEYGGYNNFAQVYIDQASPILRNLTIRHGATNGAYVSNCGPSFEDCTFFDNLNAMHIQDASPTLLNCLFDDSSQYDLYYKDTVSGTVSGCTLNSGIYLIASSMVDFTGNTFNYNAAYPIKANIDYIHSLVNGNTFANLDANSYLDINGSALTRDSTWTAAIPLLARYGLTVQGTDGQDSITTLTIEPGATLKFSTGQSLKVGAASGAPGALVAQGTAADPITFTSSQTTPAAGDWYGIKIYNTADDATTRLEHCIVAYPGKSGYIPAGAVEITDAAPTLANCTFTDSYHCDLAYAGTVGGSVTGCTFNSGIYLQGTSTVALAGNTINYNPAYPSKADADNVHSLVNGNTFANLDAGSYLQVNGGTLSRDALWTNAIPLEIYGSLTVQGTDGADGVTTLSIEPGARLKFKYASSVLTIGNTTGDPGALVAQGTAENMILFTSSQAAPQPGDWHGLYFAPTADESSCLEHCLIEYGGSNSVAVYMNNSKVPIRNSIIRSNQGTGLHISGANCNGVEIQCNTFENNYMGIYNVTGLPNIELNNFMNNTYCGLRSYQTSIVAENNWWNDPAGPNQGGDQTVGDVDADPWSDQLIVCSPVSSNNAPYEPTDPAPADNAVRVSAGSPMTLTWAGGDPDPQDTVVYDIYLGTSAETLTLDAQDVTGASHAIAEPVRGITYYWQVTARDSQGLEATGPVWRFTTGGDQPDLIISQVVTDPPGNLQTGQNLNIIATVMNSGTGPVVDSFDADVKIDGTSIGTLTVNEVILAGQSVQLSYPWTYAGGNPTVTVKADSALEIGETDEQNNQFSALFSAVADMTAPSLTSTSPALGAFVQQVNQVAFTLADSQSQVDPAAVISGFSIIDSSQQSVPGDVAEADDTFTFTPATAPMADGTYTVSLVAADIHGNTQNFAFTFTVDSQPPAKPVITGGTVTSGTIQPRPAQNISDQFAVALTGTREADTSVLIDGSQKVESGDTPWSVYLQLQPGDNSVEVRLKDRAGNIGEPEWVDISVTTASAIQIEYDAAGRVKRINSNQ